MTRQAAARANGADGPHRGAGAHGEAVARGGAGAREGGLDAALERFGAYVDGLIDDDPERARAWLLRSFRAERLKEAVAPAREALPSSRLESRLCLDAVIRALANPSEAVLTSIFLPSEPFHAMGLQPLIAEAIGEFVSGAHAEGGFAAAAEDRGVPQTYCSFHRVMLGAVATGVIAAPPMVAGCSVACDANNISFEWIATHLGAARCYVDVPYEPSEGAVAYVADQLREMTGIAQQAYGRALDRDALVQAVARGQRTLALMEDSLRRRRGRALGTTPTLEMMRLSSLYMLLGTDGVEEVATRLADDLDAAPRHDGLSLMWLHVIPYYSPTLRDVLAPGGGVQVVATDMAYAQFRPGGFRHAPDEPYEAMAERLVYNSLNGPGRRRIARAIDVARATGADGMVVFNHWGCKETAGLSQLAKRDAEAAGIPTLVLDGDGCMRANMPEGQVATRVHAFLEMLREGRARGGRAHEGGADAPAGVVAGEAGTRETTGEVTR
ncbi:2-hydroxyacyl-CoA dehydratase [bacterium]|nr:2-hydroxyacyl-CoA dehydratase [bacterium]